MNKLHGSIPNELGKLSGLGYFQLYGNNLSGMIPSSIYNISSIYYFSVTRNQLHGQLPLDVGLTLPNLEIFAGGVNSFTGRIPVSLANASKLKIVDFAINGLTGSITGDLGRLQGLERINFDDNRLGRGDIDGLSFFTFLANCSSLKVLGLANNGFGGEFPSSIANLSTQLQVLSLGLNLIHGNIPIAIGNLVNLTLLGLEENNLSGSIPDVIGRLHKLEELDLNTNKFSGSFPSSFGNLTALTWLSMQENKVEGSIPPSLGDCQLLQALNLSRNNLNGTIPKQVFGLSSLSVSLSMAHNFLTGSLPVEVGNLKNLAELDLSGNKLSGEIPSSLASCTSLVYLRLASNTFEGKIPQSLQSLRGLEELDLSSNNLTGQIPEFLGKLVPLRLLNLSFNELDGEVPKEGIFANATVISVIGNDKLCGGVPELLLPVCSWKKPGKLLTSNVIQVIAAVTLALLLLCSFGIYRTVKNSRRHSTALSSSDGQLHLSYWDVSKSTNNFSEENLIGSGSFGHVYKATLPGDRKIVAIKLLNLQQQGASRSFIDECNALRSIRHRNILRIITVCSSIDHQGNDFKALVFEFLSNGSLDQWQHPSDEDKRRNKKLSLIQRLNIAIGVAYLLLHCIISITIVKLPLCTAI
ncbi:hypothetical protein Ddye_010094 [Dipteronia dyeriana]|uniref:non-specific serine/threonine protein kinase n=1 Tax=Dipteronia dyeriana TaxID=168575 RepID=A0AAE0CMW8_9ROSI|nr:hypothetical protein Ddye_010094 [Dipteronia dyeriana]